MEIDSEAYYRDLQVHILLPSMNAIGVLWLTQRHTTGRPVVPPASHPASRPHMEPLPGSGRLLGPDLAWLAAWLAGWLAGSIYPDISRHSGSFSLRSLPELMGTR